VGFAVADNNNDGFHTSEKKDWTCDWKNGNHPRISIRILGTIYKNEICGINAAQKMDMIYLYN
jgi:hypothetical protein